LFLSGTDAEFRRLFRPLRLPEQQEGNQDYSGEETAAGAVQDENPDEGSGKHGGGEEKEAEGCGERDEDENRADDFGEGGDGAKPVREMEIVKELIPAGGKFVEAEEEEGQGDDGAGEPGSAGLRRS
jgi:hypothetical protein